MRHTLAEQLDAVVGQAHQAWPAVVKVEEVVVDGRHRPVHDDRGGVRLGGLRLELLVESHFGRAKSCLSHAESCQWRLGTRLASCGEHSESERVRRVSDFMVELSHA